jgi:hypothetical protein
MTDEQELRSQLEAVELCIADGRWDRAEDGLVDALSEVRKRKATEHADD